MPTSPHTLLVHDAGRGWAKALEGPRPPSVAAVRILSSPEEVLEALGAEPTAAALLDGPLLRAKGHALLLRLRRIAPGAPVAAVESPEAPPPMTVYLRHGVQEVFFTPVEAFRVAARLAVWFARERENRALRERAREHETKAGRLERELPFLRLGELTGRERWVREFLGILTRVFDADEALAVLPEGADAEVWIASRRAAPAARLRELVEFAKREFEARQGARPGRYHVRNPEQGAAGQLGMDLLEEPLHPAAFALASGARSLGTVVLGRRGPLTEVETGLVSSCLAQAAEALERMLLTEELQHSRETYRLMIDRIEDLIFTIDADLRIVEANRAALRRLGYRRTQLGRIGVLDIVAPEHREAVRERLDRVLHREDFGKFLRVDLLPRSGRPFRAEVRATVMRRRSRRPVLVGVARDLTAQEEWDLRSYTDPTTGLVNRAKFAQLLERELRRLSRVGGRLALMMIDLDYFKRINDAHGHAEGDRALRELGDVLRRTLRDTDIPARWAGDEFAVMLPHTAAGQALQFAERLRAEARAIRPGADGVGGADARGLTLSIGVADVGAEDGPDAQTLLARADKALYEAKGRGRDRAVLEGA